MSDLSVYAEACLESALYDVDTLDIEALRDKARDSVAQEAESACIYANACFEIISRYERDVDDSDIDDLTSGKEYKAGEWQEAMTAYANAVAYAVIGRMVDDRVAEIEEAAEHLVEAGTEWGAEDIDMDSLHISGSCAHGWAVHDKEDAEGVCFWSEPNLEGCRAVAIKTGSLWLSYTWTPAAADTTEES